MSDASPVKLTVVIPAYNYAHTLKRAVDSVSAQLTDECELIVINDGSTDHTAAVMEGIENEGRARHRFVHKENGGLSSVRNRGINEAQGDYLIFLDADDELAPLALSRILEHIDENPHSRMVIGGHVAVSESGKSKNHLPGMCSSDPLDRLRAYLIDKRLTLSNGACAMHKEIFSKGTYPEHFRSTEDIPVFAQALANFHCTVLDEPLAIIHKHGDSLRHQFVHARAGGLALVDEVFSSLRLPPEFEILKTEFYLQRCLSLFRTAYLAGERQAAKEYFTQAMRCNPAVLLKFSYSRKALRLWVWPGRLLKSNLLFLSGFTCLLALSYEY